MSLKSKSVSFTQRKPSLRKNINTMYTFTGKNISKRNLRTNIIKVQGFDNLMKNGKASILRKVSSSPNLCPMDYTNDFDELSLETGKDSATMIDTDDEDSSIMIDNEEVSDMDCEEFPIRSHDFLDEYMKNSSLGKFQDDIFRTKLYLNNLLKTSFYDTKTKIHVIKTLWK